MSKKPPTKTTTKPAGAVKVPSAEHFITRGPAELQHLESGPRKQQRLQAYLDHDLAEALDLQCGGRNLRSSIMGSALREYLQKNGIPAVRRLLGASSAG